MLPGLHCAQARATRKARRGAMEEANLIKVGVKGLCWIWKTAMHCNVLCWNSVSPRALMIINWDAREQGGFGDTEQ